MSMNFVCAFRLGQEAAVGFTMLYTKWKMIFVFNVWFQLKGQTYFKQICSFKLQVCLSKYDLLVETSR